MTPLLPAPPDDLHVTFARWYDVFTSAERGADGQPHFGGAAGVWRLSGDPLRGR